MLIRVREVMEDLDSTVVCDSDAGALTVRWSGGAAPRVGDTHDAELDAGGSLVWGAGMSIVSSDSPSELVQTLSARVEDIEGDSVTVRVGSALLLLEVAGDPPNGAVGELVTLTPQFFQAWPTNI